MNHLKLLSLQTKPTTGTGCSRGTHRKKKRFLQTFTVHPSLGAAAIEHFCPDSENQTTLSFPWANIQKKPSGGIRASGEDGLIDRERREGSRNQDRPRGRPGGRGNLCTVCSEGTGTLQPQPQPLAPRPRGLCAACPHPERGSDRATQAKAWAPGCAGGN